MASTDHPPCAHVRCCKKVEVRLQLGNPEPIEEKEGGSESARSHEKMQLASLRT
jgi:hypothetical protein